MSAKKAKRIRREIKYHPTEKHQYIQLKTGTIECHPESKRSLYLAMKRDKS